MDEKETDDVSIVVNTGDEPEQETPDNTVVVAPTIIVTPDNDEPETETREEIEQEVHENDAREARILELERQVFDLTHPEPEDVSEPEVIESLDIEEENEPEETESVREDENEPERAEPKSAGSHPLFKSWGDWFGKDK